MRRNRQPGRVSPWTDAAIVGGALLAGAARASTLPSPTDNLFHLVRVGRSLLSGSLDAFAFPPGGQGASPLGAAVTGIATLFTSDAELVSRALGAILRRLWSLFVAGCIAIWLATGLLATADTGLLAALLGLSLCIYSAISLTTPQVPPPGRWEPLLTPTTGVATGFLCGLTGSFVVYARVGVGRGWPIWLVILSSYLGWFFDFPDPSNYIEPFAQSEASAFIGTNYVSDEMDAFLAAGGATVDPGEREGIYGDAQALYAEDVVTIPLSTEVEYAVFREETVSSISTALSPALIFQYELIELQ